MHRKTRDSLFGLLLSIAIAAAGSSGAQPHVNHEKGLHASSYLSDTFDHVNLYNGNLTLTLPIGQQYSAGGNLKYQLQLVYNSTGWVYKTEEEVPPGEVRTWAEPNPKANAGLGWMLSLGAVYAPRDGFRNQSYQHYLYVSPDGAEHALVHGGDGRYYSTDGTFLRLDVSTLTLEFPDGNVHTFDPVSRQLKKMRDRFNNALNVAITPTQWTLTDTQGRTHTVNFVNGRVSRITMSTFTGNAHWDLGYEENVVLPRDIKDNWSTSSDNVTVAWLKNVTLPADAGTYAFEYDTVDKISRAHNPGVIRSATLPTLGHYEWTWTLYQRAVVLKEHQVPFDPDYLRPYANTEGVQSKKIYARKGTTALGAVTYNGNAGGIEASGTDRRGHVIVRVTSAENNDTEYFFNTSFGIDDKPGETYGLPFSTADLQFMTVTTPRETTSRKVYLSRRHYKGTGANRTLMRSVYVSYDVDGQYESGGPPVYPRQTAERTVFHDDANYIETVYQGWNGLGRFRTVKSYGSFPMDSIVRTEFTDYQDTRPTPQDAWILNLYTERTLQEGKSASDPIARTWFCFDPTNGALMRKRILGGNTFDGSDLFVAYGYTNGNLTSEAFYGGDDLPKNAPNLDKASLCGGTINTTPDSTLYHAYAAGVRMSSWNVLPEGNLYSLRQTIEGRSGLASESYDSSNVKTTYAYDALGRVTKITASTGTVTDITYTAAQAAANAGALAEYKTRDANGIVTWKKLRGDPFGRLARESEVLPGYSGAATERVSEYTASGWLKSVSEYGNAAKKTQYDNFDAFGRATVVTAPDGTVTNLKYRGVSSLERKRQIGTQIDSGVVSTTGAVVLEQYDAQGRLIAVREKSGPGNAEVVTDYDYEPGGKISKVTINHGGWSGTGRKNVALAANGATAHVSSLYDGNRFPAEAMINGDRKGIGWGFGTGGWSDGTALTWPDYAEIHFDGEKLIDEIGIYTLQDDPSNPVEPTEATTFTLNGIQDFKVGYWNASTNAWVYLPAVVNNDKVWRRFVLAAPVRTSKLSIVITRSVKNYSRIVEVTALEVASGATAAAQTRSFTYDRRGFLTAETHPEITGPVTYRYDAVGRNIEKTEGNHRLVYAYDAAGRITTVHGADSAAKDKSLRELKTFEYEKSNVAGSFGRLDRATRHNWVVNPYRRCVDDPSTYWDECPTIDVKISERYDYDAHGRVSTRTTVFPDDPTTAYPYTFAQSFFYDQSNNLVRQSYPACQNATCVSSGAQVPREVTYRYDLNRLVGVGVAGQPTAYGAIAYHPNRMISTVVHGNGVTDTYGMDGNHMPRIGSISFSGPSVNYALGAYGYDGAGNVIRIGADWYSYDPANRIKEGSAGPEGAGRRKQRYVHDALGNLEQVVTTNGHGTATTLDVRVDPATNRLLDSYYDAAGNFLGLSAGAVYSYDPLNMMQTSPGRTYLYGPSDERMWIVDKMYNDLGTPPSTLPPVTETITLRGLGNEVLREYQITQRWPNTSEGDVAGNWLWTKDWIYRGTQLIAAELPGNGEAHYHLDHLGSTRIVTNQAGAKFEEYWFYPYGGDALANGYDRIRFTGHERDYNRAPGHKLDYMHARFYGMDVARFTSVDPGRDFDPREPQSWNRYTYVRGNPMNATDPDGKETFKQARTDGMDHEDLTALENDRILGPDGTVCDDSGCRTYVKTTLPPNHGLNARTRGAAAEVALDVVDLYLNGWENYANYWAGMGNGSGGTLMVNWALQAAGDLGPDLKRKQSLVNTDSPAYGAGSLHGFIGTAISGARTNGVVPDWLKKLWRAVP